MNLLLCIAFVIAVNLTIIAKCLDDVRLPPSILKSPVDAYIYRVEETISLPCSASGTPKPTYEWHKNGEPLNLNMNNLRRLNDGDIELTSAGPFDEGHYQCIATNQHGSTRSNTTVLRKAFLQDPPPATVNDIRVVEGQPFRIDFMPLRSYPSPQYRWASADKSLTSQNTFIDLVKSKRMQWAENGNLYFSYALPVDELNGRIYKGLTFNPRVDISAGGSYTTVTVARAPNGIKRFIPTLSFSSPSETIGLDGGEITLRCFFAGYDDPEIHWSGPNNVLPVGRTFRENFNTELKIVSLKQYDEGNYTCTGRNSVGSTPQKIRLIVQVVPVFNDSFPGPRNMNATDGDSVTFQCNPFAKPKAKIVWMINGKPLDANNLPSRVSISSNDHNLTIRSVCRDCNDRVSFSDLMVIQCNASNEYGYAFRAGYLNVLKKTSVTLASDSKAVIVSNSRRSLNFQCFPFSDPSTPVRILWYRLFDSDQQQTIVYSEPPVVAVGNGTLTITAGSNTSDWAKHGGKYKCVADNGYSNAEQLVEIQVNIDNVTLASTASILDFWWIFVIIACFFLFLILILICCICIFRNRGDKYDVDGKERKNGNDPEKELVASGFHDYQRREIEPFKGSQNSLGSSARLFGDEEASEAGDNGKVFETGSYHSISYANTTDRKKGRSEYI